MVVPDIGWISDVVHGIKYSRHVLHFRMSLLADVRRSLECALCKIVPSFIPFLSLFVCECTVSDTRGLCCVPYEYGGRSWERSWNVP